MCIFKLQRVDYDGISKSQDFKRYQEMTLLLHRVKVEDASREEKLAFFINVYNALVIHANVVRGPPTNLWQRYKVCLLFIFRCNDMQLTKIVSMSLEVDNFTLLIPFYLYPVSGS